MSILSCVLVVAAVFLLAKIYTDGFLLFGSLSAEPGRITYTDVEVRLFFLSVIVGSGLICAANALYRHSAKAIISLLALYVLFFGRNYKLVLNGFVRAANKLLYAALRVEGKTPKQYYLTYFDIPEAGAKKELYFFLYAAVFAITFLLAYVGVRRCSAFWFAALTLGCVSVPLAFNCFDSEGCLIALFIICIVMYAVRVEGYRRVSLKNTVTNFGSTLRINGKYSSLAAFEQSVIFLVSSALLLSVLNAAVDLQGFRRSAAADDLGKDIMYTAESIVSGTFFDELGIGTSSSLNNGRLSRLGDLEYSGRTMFEIKAKTSNPIYLRSFSAAEYTGRQWEQLPGKTLRSYDFWEVFAQDGYYPQFALTYKNNGHSGEDIVVTIKNRGINHKRCLTDYRMIPSQSPNVTSKASCKYDGCFTFDRFGGESSYSQTISNVFNVRRSAVNHNGNMPTGEPYDVLSEILRDGDFEDYELLSGSYLDEEPGSEAENEKLYRSFVAENYLSYPDDIDEWLPAGYTETISAIYGQYVWDDGFNYTLYRSDVEGYVRTFLAETCEYTLEPGRTPGRRDFTEYFINENHKGYCVHFATAAVLMLRRAGIPARYCEGYVVTGEDLAEAADDYTAIPDSNGHAWAEVYTPAAGWQVVEFTPGYSDGAMPEENKEYDTDSDTESDADSDETDSGAESDADSDQTDSDTETDTDTESDEPALPEPETESQTPGSTTPKAPSKVLNFFLGVLRVLLIALLIAALYIALRFGVKKLRVWRFTREDTKKGALAMYFFALRLMYLAGVKKQRREGDEAFASRAAKLLPGADARKLREFTRTALSARFGRTPPSRESTDKMLEYLSTLTRAVTAQMPAWKKFIIKHVLFID